jgi:hypothetical protein
MWDIIDHTSSVLGILGFILALVGLPKFLRGAKSFSQWLLGAWSLLLLVWACLLLLHVDWAARLTEAVLRRSAAFASTLGLSPSASWTTVFVFYGAALAVLLAPLKVAAVRTDRLMALSQPVLRKLQKQYGQDRQRLALKIQRYQQDANLNPLLGWVSYALISITACTGFLVLADFDRSVLKESYGALTSSSLLSLMLVGVVILTRIAVHWLTQKCTANQEGWGFGSWPRFLVTCAVIGVIAASLSEGRILVAALVYYLVQFPVLAIAARSHFEIDPRVRAKWFPVS